MEELSNLEAVTSKVKKYMAAADFSHPMLVLTTTLDREDGVGYVIDSEMGSNHINGLFVSHPIDRIKSKLGNADWHTYMVVKLYFAVASDLEAKEEKSLINLISSPINSKIPVFIIVAPNESMHLIESQLIPNDINYFIF